MNKNAYYYIIGLCAFFSVFLSVIFYKTRYEEYVFEEKSLISLDLRRNENLALISNLDDEIAKIKANRKQYENLDDLYLISFTNNEFKRFLYNLSIKYDLEIKKISEDIIKGEYSIYTLKYVAVEFKGNFKSIFDLIMELSNYSKHIDLKEFSLYITGDTEVLSFGYIERSDNFE